MNSLVVAIHLSNAFDYASVRGLISCMGQAHELQPSLVFVATIFSAEEAFQHLKQALKEGDALTIVDAVGGVITTSKTEAPDSFNAIRCFTHSFAEKAN